MVSSRVFIEDLTFGSEIEEWLAKLRQFKGCISSLDEISSKECGSYVVNVDDHWCGLCITNKYCLYFDPLCGEISKQFYKFFATCSQKIVTSMHPVQSQDSQLCGKYSALFCCLVKDKASYKHFINLFHPNKLKHNDEFVRCIFFFLCEQ